MINRRNLLQALAGGSLVPSILAEPLKQALAIDPAPGSTYLDAEHIVFLMQENRSFDHLFGSLQGVRGFNDPRAVEKPDGDPVWIQKDAKGQAFTPFRLKLRDSNSTWLGCLPHSRGDQVAATNAGAHDRWLHAKASKHGPLTLGHHTRDDLPFYYALADAFTVCDQNFCSSLTGTTPNRLHFWSGTIRSEQKVEAKACTSNGDCTANNPTSWKTFPERLSEAGIEWRIYQNQLSREVGVGLSGEADQLLGNFDDNPLEGMAQYRVHFSPERRAEMHRLRDLLPGEIAAAESALAAKPGDDKLKKRLERLKSRLAETAKFQEEYTAAAWQALTPAERDLHERAFTVNRLPDSRDIETVDFQGRQVTVPKGDLFARFRQDAKTGKLPAVSWLVAPRDFSDHPDAPWYGAWYVSEALAILSADPELWRKTIFILAYDENDGYYDHVPPFTAPDPQSPATGACSRSADGSLEFDRSDRAAIGLGYRVPLVVCSPWSRGGWINSQVCDHTSSLRFLEHFFATKKKAQLREDNISPWRRAVCGDLRSCFRPWMEGGLAAAAAVRREAWIDGINQARAKPLPDAGKPLTPEEIARIRTAPRSSPRLPKQEPGTRPSCALPYELVANLVPGPEGRPLLRLEARREVFGELAAGAPFQLHGLPKVAHFAVAAGEELCVPLELPKDNENYRLRLHGPNGFYREFCGVRKQPLPVVALAAQKSVGSLQIEVSNPGAVPVELALRSRGYAQEPRRITLAPGAGERIVCALEASQGWYDFELSVPALPAFRQRFAGRTENGKSSVSDPLMS